MDASIKKYNHMNLKIQKFYLFVFDAGTVSWVLETDWLTLFKA